MSAHFKALLGVVAAVFVLGAGFFYFYGSREEPKAVPSLSAVERMKDEAVPSIKMADLSGQAFDLESLKGKIVVVNFWASWCEPCVEEVPSLINLVEKMNGKLALVAISGDSDRVEIDSFLKSFPGLKRPGIHLLWDDKKDVMQNYAVERLPETFIVGPDLKLIKKVVGSIKWDAEESVKYFQEIAGSKAL